MRVQEHIKLSTAAAIIVLPWLKKDVWIPFAASIFIDVDHYLWHVVSQRTLSLRAAIRYFGQANPVQTRGAKFLHHPMALGFLLLLAIRLRSRFLGLLLAGLCFHVCLDTIHVTMMGRLKRALDEQAQGLCAECHQPCDALQLHTVYVARNLLDRYNSRHFVALCPACHQQAHATKMS